MNIKFTLVLGMAVLSTGCTGRLKEDVGPISEKVQIRMDEMQARNDRERFEKYCSSGSMLPDTYGEVLCNFYARKPNKLVLEAIGIPQIQE